MAVAKLTCPKCRAVLRPAKPVPEGKAVKCPKCEQTFKAGEDTSEGKPAKKPAAAAAAAKPDEDEDGGTYAVVRDEAEDKKRADAEERERRKRKKRRMAARGQKVEDDDDDDDDEEDDLSARLLRNLKTRDPRGKAQESIVRPANWLLITALLGFFGWVGYFIVFMIPVAFPNKQEEDQQVVATKGLVSQQMLDKVQQKGPLPFATVNKLKPLVGKTFANQTAFLKEVRKVIPDREDVDCVARNTVADFPKGGENVHWWSAETILDEENTPVSVLLFIFVLLVGVTQAAFMSVASTKIQSLESHRWGIVGMVLAIIPLTSFPLFVLLTSVLDLLDSAMDGPVDERDWTWCVALVAFVFGPIVGAIGLKAPLQQHVKQGFEFKPD